jgi:hypothetical protein
MDQVALRVRRAQQVQPPSRQSRTLPWTASLHVPLVSTSCTHFRTHATRVPVENTRPTQMRRAVTRVILAVKPHLREQASATRVNLANITAIRTRTAKAAQLHSTRLPQAHKHVRTVRILTKRLRLEPPLPVIVCLLAQQVNFVIKQVAWSAQLERTILATLKPLVTLAHLGEQPTQRALYRPRSALPMRSACLESTKSILSQASVILARAAHTRQLTWQLHAMRVLSANTLLRVDNLPVWHAQRVKQQDLRVRQVKLTALGLARLASTRSTRSATVAIVVLQENTPAQLVSQRARRVLSVRTRAKQGKSLATHAPPEHRQTWRAHLPRHTVLVWHAQRGSLTLLAVVPVVLTALKENSKCCLASRLARCVA